MTNAVNLASAAGTGFFRNRIINGNFDIWQRGTSFSSTSVNEYSADRFRTEGYSNNTTISQQTFTQGQTAVPGYPRYFCRVALNASNTNGYWAFQQRIEAPVNMNGDGTYTLSFWIKATSGTVAAGAWSYGINSLTSGPALTTTWQKVTQTITLSGVSESSYISVYLFYLAQNSAAVSVDIAQVQVEAGSTATPFERRQYGHELALCQRYYWKSYAQGTAPGTVTTVGASGLVTSTTSSSVIVLNWDFPSAMRAIPTLTVYSPTGAAGYNYLNGGWATTGGTDRAINYSSASETHAIVIGTTTGGLDGYYIMAHLVASAEL